MGDENPIRTLGDYSKPSHEGYRNTIELPVGNNVLAIGLNVFQQDPSPHGRILLPDSLLNSFHREGPQNSAWTRFKDLLQKVPHHGIDLWLQVQIFYDHVNPVTRRTIDQSADGKLCDRNAEESWALLEDLAIYDNESWNDPRDFAKPVKAIALPQDVPSTSDRCLIELENQICSGPHDTQYCMEDPEQAFFEYASSRTDEAGDARLTKFEADFKQQQSGMTNKIDTVLKATTDRIAGTLPSDTVKNLKLSTYPVFASYNNGEKENKKEEDNPENIHVDPPTPPDPSVTFIIKKVLKFNSFFESLGLVPPSSNTELICTKEEDGDVMFIEIILKDENSRKDEPEAEGKEVEYFDIFPTRSELAYHKYLMCGPIPSIFI
ncbi:hypothetical protein Tco_0676889 [Tanacetum coccineum]